MKASVLYTAVALAAFASGYTGTSAFENRASKITRVAFEEGADCVDEWGHSGYMVSGGRTGDWECRARNNS